MDSPTVNKVHIYNPPVLLFDLSQFCALMLLVLCLQHFFSSLNSGRLTTVSESVVT